jgi:hypothetical protein
MSLQDGSVHTQGEKLFRQPSFSKYSYIMCEPICLNYDDRSCMLLGTPTSSRVHDEEYQEQTSETEKHYQVTKNDASFKLGTMASYNSN